MRFPALICFNSNYFTEITHRTFAGMKSIEKTDPLTGEVFTALRSNQVFANNENRIRYNNLKAKELRENKSHIDKPLLNNYRILNVLMTGKTEEFFHKQFLLGRGYSFLVLTHYEEHNEKKCIAVYNFILLPLDGDKIKVIRK